MKNLYLGPSASTIRPQPTGACYNCQATVSGNFCAQCGQQAHLHVASVHEFLHHFIGHYVAAEGKLWPTLKALFSTGGKSNLRFEGNVPLGPSTSGAMATGDRKKNQAAQNNKTIPTLIQAVRE